MAQAHNIIRLDRMSGTKDDSKVFSVKVYVDTTPTAADNGIFVEITPTLVTDEREVFKATPLVVGANGIANARNVGILATPEVVYDSRKDDLADFTNEADSIARAYLLEEGDTFSIKFSDSTKATEAAKYTVGTPVTIGDMTLNPIAKDSEGYDVVLRVVKAA